MGFLQFIRGEVEAVQSTVRQQKQQTSGILDKIKSFVPKVMGAWKGGDEEQFEREVATRLIPATVELIAAIGGVDLNLKKATGVLDAADNKAKSLANGLGDVFSKI